MRIFVDMDDLQASTRTSSRPMNRTATATATASVPVPKTCAEASELRELLETHLRAMQALLEEHQRTMDRSLRALGGSRAELRTQLLPELRALADHRAPWVRALAETRALLFVALREVVVSGSVDGGEGELDADADAGATIQMPTQVAELIGLIGLS